MDKPKLIESRHTCNVAEDAKPVPAQLARLHQLMPDDVLLDRAWTELNGRQRLEAPQATIEALVMKRERMAWLRSSIPTALDAFPIRQLRNCAI